MKKTLTIISKNPIVSGSAVLLLGNNLANVIAYLYHFVLGRMLGKADYGELVVLLSILSLLSSTYSFLGPLVMKSVAGERNLQAAKDKFSSLYKIFVKPALVITFVLFGFIFFVDKLQMHLVTAVLIPPIFFVSFLVFLYKAYLQGVLKFFQLSIATIFEIALRLSFGVVLVLLGFGANGVALGFFFAVFIFALVLRKYIGTSSKEMSVSYKEFVKHGVPIFVSSIATTAFFTVDVLLVRVFFGSIDSGTYAAAATLGKTVLFSATPITAVLFPLIARKHSLSEDDTLIFLMSLVLTVLCGGAFALVFFVFPQLSISILYGQAFSGAGMLLFPFSVFMLLLVSSLVFINYYLPKEQYLPIKALATASIAQIVGIVVFHDSLLTVIRVSTYVSLALFVCLLIYFGYENRSFRKYLAKALRYYPRV